MNPLRPTDAYNLALAQKEWASPGIEINGDRSCRVILLAEQSGTFVFFFLFFFESRCRSERERERTGGIERQRERE